MSGSLHSSSNHAECSDWLLEGVRSFGFHSPARGGKSLGEAIVDNNTAHIRERSFAEQRGAGEPWPKNDPEYAAEKERDYGVVDQVNVQTKQMLSEESVHGQATISDRLVEHVYGTNQPGDPQKNKRPRAGRGGKPSTAKTRTGPTDVEKAQWAEEQGRGFFEFDEMMKDANNELAGDSLADHLRSR